MVRDNRSLRRAVGIGIDASSKVTGRKGGSEDFYALEVGEWTPELDEIANELKKDFGLLKQDNVTAHCGHLPSNVLRSASASL